MPPAPLPPTCHGDASSRVLLPQTEYNALSDDMLEVRSLGCLGKRAKSLWFPSRPCRFTGLTMILFLSAVE
eukprot:756984-Hanusia_phi.AAC.2